MKIERLEELLQTPERVKDAFEKEKPTGDIETFAKQYDVSQHDVFDTSIRADKTIKDKDGTITGVEPVARIGVPMQKIITQTAAAFLCGNPVKLAGDPEGPAEERLMEGVMKVWEDNKLDFKSMDLAERMMAETQVAELWYTEELEGEALTEYWGDSGINGKFRLRMKTLSPALGDTLRPIFDPTGNMIAFGRGYNVSSEGETEEHFDIYTDKNIYYGVKAKDGKFTVESKPNVIGKIPVIYYAQETPEWADVQTAIDRLEMILSKHADTNDYSGAPILLLTGSIESMPEKKEDGKAIVMEQGADAKFLSWDHAPESTKLEIEHLFRIIYSCTSTPDISFDSLKGAGAQSGFALEFMFMGAHLKAAKKAALFGEGIQRRINYIKSALSKIDLSLKQGMTLMIRPQFEFYLPKDSEGQVNMLTTAVQGKIMSKRTAVEQLGVAEDVDTELEEISKDESSGGALGQLVNEQI